MTAVDRCPVDHARAKRDADLWRTLTFTGVQHLPAYDDEPASALELRTCACGTTLAKELTP